MVNINSFVELAREYTSFEKLTPGMLHELVEKIIVHEGDKSSGHRIQKSKSIILSLATWRV